MSNRKHRDSQQAQSDNAESSKPEPQGTVASSSPGKSPTRFMALFWGLPLLLFVVIAVVKQCGN